MIVCLCHPFSDKKVRKHLAEKGERANVGDVYKTCSGGESPQCCTCLSTLKDIVKTHNKGITA